MSEAAGNNGFTLIEHVDGYSDAGDRVKGAVIDEIILSDGADVVNIEGSAFGVGVQQVLRPGYADETSGNPFTNVMLQNVEIIRLEDGTEYHLLQGGTGTLNDFYYYASDARADISGLGDDRQHIVYKDSDHLGGSFSANNSTGQDFVWIDTRDDEGKGHRFEMAVEYDAVVASQVSGHTGWIIQNQKVDTFQSHSIGTDFSSDKAIQDQLMNDAALKGILRHQYLTMNLTVRFT